ncbi:MAG: VWA domain-containing protein [Clostridiaceae bacterium]
MKKILSVLLAAVLIFGCFSGCQNGSKNEPKVKTTKNVKGPKTGPVGKWDIPIPEINPLGTQSLYTTTGYNTGGHEIRYLENFTENTKNVEGEVWTLEVADPSGIPLEFLKEYAQKIGASTFSSAYGDRLTFTYKKDEDSLWWGDALQTDQGYTLSVIKEAHVPAGKEVKFSTANVKAEDNPNISFVTQTDGSHFQSATVNVPSGSLTVHIEGSYKTGILERSINYQRELSSKKTSTFVLDDLPQVSEALTWKFVWEPDNTPAEFTFKLDELGEIPQVKQGDDLGALKVCGVPFGSASIEPQNGIEYSYGENYSIEGDMTPEGDTLFWVPAGLWNLLIPTGGTGLASCKTRLVPVNAGEMTVVTVPDSLSSAFSTLNRIYADPENLTGGIEITETRDEGSTATVSMLVNDPKDRNVFPSKENTTITEGGQKVEILDITRQIAPPSVVLVLDSSGSMGKQMAATLEAAKKFISGLPDKTFVKVIDFDSQIRVLKGDTKDTVIKSLSSVTASGSTMLFDATLEGIKLLEGKGRPALVVFADGADSSVDGQGQGSSATKDEVIETVKEAGIPLYTIGFGDKADKQALKDFSAASGGEYYSAKDNKALESVFEAIGSKFGNSFIMKYKRPTETALSDTPVVTFIMDASGSMDTDPAEDDGCGFRIDKTKALFHDFVLKLPDQCLLQMMSFQTATLGGPILEQRQITTNEKVKILQAIGDMNASGGTPVLEAIETGYENLKAVPTNKRVIVYVTDAGLEVSEEDQDKFEDLLGKIKKDNITVLWAGMGVPDKEDLFKKAAELSGGRYVVSEDVNGLKSALEEILGLIGKESGSKLIPLSVVINEKTASGDVFSYAASTDVEFSMPAKSGKAAEPQVVELSTGTPLKRYDTDVAGLITGMSLTGSESIMSKRVAFNTKSSNKAMELNVKEAFFFDKFKGLEPPEGKQFLALQLEMKNVTADKIQYQIPCFQNHFYVAVNNEGSYPASDATWLAETPAAAPGEPEMNIFPDKNLSGIMVFLIPKVPLTQVSLHFYDTDNGHINLPLIGKASSSYLQLDKLPQTAPAKITDAFSMSVSGTKLVDKVDKYKAGDNTSFRIIEADFNTNVQALLDIDPSKRFFLKINTNSGSLMTKMSDATAALPYGFMSSVMLAPSSLNKVRLAYSVANALSGTQAEIWGDLQSGSMQIPVVNGKAYGSAVNKNAITAQGLQLKVNQLTTLGGVEGYHSGLAVADVTFTCPSGTDGADIPEDIFCLVRNDLVQSFENMDISANSSNRKKENNQDSSAGSQNNSAGNSDQKDESGGSSDDSKDNDGSDESSGDNEEASDDASGDDSGDIDAADGETSSDDSGVTSDDANSDGSASEDSQAKANSDSSDSNASAGGAGLGNFATGGNEGILLPDLNTKLLLYGIDDDWNVYSGTQRRGLVLFNLPDDEHSWTLKSNYFTSLNEPLAKSQYSSAELLVNKTEIPLFDKEFEKQLEEAVKIAILKYESCKSSEGNAGFIKTVDFTQGNGKNYIPMPSIVTHGTEKIKSVKTLDEAFKTLSALKWLPSEDELWNHRYSNEAVLTQGWGTEWDLGYLAACLISKAGLAPKQRLIQLTDAGKNKLTEMYPLNEMKCKYLPGIAYTDEKGAARLFVVPFMKDITELEGLVYIPEKQDIDEYAPVSAKITVSASVESKGDSAAALASDAGSALGGGSGSTVILEDIELLSKEIQLPELSNDAVEVGYMEAGKGVGTLYMAAISTMAGVEPGEYAVDTGKQKILGIKIDITLPNGTLTHQTTLSENDTLDRMYHNIAINLPDLPEDAAASLQNATNKEYKAAQNPSSLSTLKWYGRNIINRFITAQTKYDKQAGEGMKLTLGRTNKERCFILTSQMGKSDNKLRTTMDLLQTVSQCHNGDKNSQAAYNLGAGMFASILEGEALTGENKASFLQMWAKAPKDAKLVLIPSNGSERDAMAEPLRKSGFPERLISNVTSNQNMILTLDKPVDYEGEKRWAWLEVNPNTYETISVMDTGEHFGVEYIELIKKVVDDGGKFIVGAFMGLEVSVWAIADFSLELSNYQDILDAASELTAGIGEYLDYVMTGIGDPKGFLAGLAKDAAGLGDVPDSIEVEMGPVTASIGFGDWFMMNLDEIEFEQNVLGFAQGYKFASDLYFEWAGAK